GRLRGCEVGRQTKQERHLLHLRRDRPAEPRVDQQVTLWMLDEGGRQYRVPILPWRATSDPEGGRPMIHPRRERGDRHACGWRSRRQRVEKRRWCWQGRGREATQEGQEPDLCRDGEASGEPVSTCDDPEVTCQERQREHQAGHQK